MRCNEVKPVDRNHPNSEVCGRKTMHFTFMSNELEHSYCNLHNLNAGWGETKCEIIFQKANNGKCHTTEHTYTHTQSVREYIKKFGKSVKDETQRCSRRAHTIDAKYSTKNFKCDSQRQGKKRMTSCVCVRYACSTLHIAYKIRNTEILFIGRIWMAHRKSSLRLLLRNSSLNVQVLRWKWWWIFVVRKTTKKKLFEK